jgi:hypothetical protein
VRDRHPEPPPERLGRYRLIPAGLCRQLRFAYRHISMVFWDEVYEFLRDHIKGVLGARDGR